jgi:myo-inositol-1(or 4)-monophosphatase
VEQLDFAIELARSAGDILRYYASRDKGVRHKGVGNLVTIADSESEALIHEGIRRRYPGDSVLAEESGAAEPQAAESGHRWIVDPLDGTTNFAHGFPMYCVSIAFESAGVIRCGVVYDPVRDETFSGTRGVGAFLNGEPLAVSGVDTLEESLLATGFPYSFRDEIEEALGLFRTFLVAARAVRRAGSAALDLSYLAAGRFDGFWELDLQPWDTAAGTVILEASGGRVSDFSGDAFSLGSRQLLASNGIIHDAMVARIGKVDSESA